MAFGFLATVVLRFFLVLNFFSLFFFFLVFLACLCHFFLVVPLLCITFFFLSFLHLGGRYCFWLVCGILAMFLFLVTMRVS